MFKCRRNVQEFDDLQSGHWLKKNASFVNISYICGSPGSNWVPVAEAVKMCSVLMLEALMSTNATPAISTVACLLDQVLCLWR